MLADEDVENHTVDSVVGPVVGHDPDLASTLTETVHASLALLVAGRIPSEIVVDHRVEVVLKVDTFGQAVGGHEHGRDVLRKLAELLTVVGSADFAPARQMVEVYQDVSAQIDGPLGRLQQVMDVDVPQFINLVHEVDKLDRFGRWEPEVGE
jgi:hypothetical protein